MQDKGKGLHMVTFLLLVIGGLNWLLVGLFGWDVGELFGGQGAIVSRIIYVLVGLSAIAELACHKKCCTKCGSGGGMKKPDMPAAKDDSNAGGGAM